MTPERRNQLHGRPPRPLLIPDVFSDKSDEIELQIWKIFDRQVRDGRVSKTKRHVWAASRQCFEVREDDGYWRFIPNRPDNVDDIERILDRYDAAEYDAAEAASKSVERSQ